MLQECGVTKMPIISVIMTVYNTDKKYFSEAIDSILHQTYTDFEFLIIDDGSTFDYSDLTSITSDKRIIYFKLSKNVGIANARNFAIEKAKGEFIAFLDSDDVAFPERLAHQINFFENNPGIDCVGSSYLIIPEGRLCHNPEKHNDIVLHLLLTGCPFLHSSVMLRKKIIAENKVLYKANYVPAEDYAFLLDLLGLCNYANIDETSVKYRWHGNNISITKVEIQQALANDAKIKKLLALIDRQDSNACNAILNYLVYPEQLSLEDLRLVEQLVPDIVKKLSSIGLEEEVVKRAFRKKITRLMRKSPVKKIIKEACFSPLNKYLNTGLHRQIFYYVLRNIIYLLTVQRNQKMLV